MRVVTIKMAVLASLMPALAAIANPGLVAVAESSSMIWNAVAVVDKDIYVAGPRWAGSRGPAVARLDAQGRPIPYPDAAWNDWREGADPTKSFVNVNAIHSDGQGFLWIVDTGSPEFGGDPLPGGAKLVQVSVTTNKVGRIISFGPDIALPGSYADDVRFHGDFAYVTDAGRPGIIIVNLASGAMRRVLENLPQTTARDDRPIVVDGVTVIAPNGKPLQVHTDTMEVSPDGHWLYFGTLEGPWFRIATESLDDFNIPAKTIAAEVESWADLPPVGGTAIDANGDLYFSDLATNALKVRTADGHMTTLVQDKRLHWVDAPFIDNQHDIWLPVPQLDRTAIFRDGKSEVQWPIVLYRFVLPKTP